MDLAFAIESFVHSPDGPRFFRSAARALRPGGKLIICDDFLSSPRPRPPPATAAGWTSSATAGASAR